MRVLVADYPDSLSGDHEREEQLLRAGLGDVEVVVHAYDPDDHDAFLAELAAAEVLLTGFLPVTATEIAAAPDLRCISINATGFDNIDLTAARAHGVAVMCIGEYCTEDVAEHTLALALALNHHLKHFVGEVDADHTWRYSSAPAPTRFVDQVLGIVGLGRIGSNVAAKARAWGMQVLATDPFIEPGHATGLGVELVGRDELLARADIVSNHMNATTENVGYFRGETFALMRRRPAFLNTARGSAVAEADLVAALDAGQVRAAGLDVLADENPDLARHPLAGRANVIITPHSAFYSTASRDALVRISVGNIVHFLRGEHDQVFKRVG